jgi:hypothetical protein
MQIRDNVRAPVSAIANFRVPQYSENWAISATVSFLHGTGFVDLINTNHIDGHYKSVSNLLSIQQRNKLCDI